MRERHGRNQGFTLIELSIVLVIIGLIIGGVLVGQDLIKAAQTRATISQIEKYNTAVDTFVTKYGYLPGDIPDPYASRFGFQARGQYAGEGDGNGLIQANFGNSASTVINLTAFSGESVTFWVDLSTAGFLDGNFTAASPNAVASYNITPTSTPLTIASILPTAKLGNGNYFYIWCSSAYNYFGIAAVSIIGDGMASSPSLTVAQAYSIDKKIDDGFPQTGTVQATYYTNTGSDGFFWAGTATSADGGSFSGITMPYTTATSGSSSTCFDNGNASGATQQYSMGQNGGAGANCALSIKMQGAAR